MAQKVLIVCGLAGYKNRMDKLDYNFMTYLQNNSNYDVSLHEAESDRENVKQILDNNADAIIIVFSAYPTYIKQYSHTKIYYVYDCCCTCGYKCNASPENCGFRNQIDYINGNCFDFVFYKYENYLIRSDLIKKPKFKFPHFMFDTNLYNNKHITKEYDILFYGATYPAGYPFRNKMFYLLKNNTDKFNIKFLPYTKRHSEKMTVGEDLVIEINKAWLTIACKNIADLLLAKYYEIAMSGSVICGDYPDLEDEQFLRSHMVYIDIHMTDEQIIEIIENALKDKQKLLDNADVTFDYLSNRYTMDHGVKYFDDLIEKVIVLSKK